MRKHLGAALLLGLGALTALPAAAVETTPSSTAATTGAWHDLALAIANEEQIQASSKRLLDAMMEQFAQDPDMAEMETEFPGLLQSFRSAMTPLIQSEIAHTTPLYRADLEALYREKLSEPHTREATAFVTSPQFQRFLETYGKNARMRTTARDLVKTDKVTSDAILSDVRSSALQTSLQMDGADLRYMEEFYATEAGINFKALNPAKIEIDRKWANYVSPEASAQVVPLVLNAMIEHVGKTDPETAAAMRENLAGLIEAGEAAVPAAQ